MSKPQVNNLIRHIRENTDPETAEKIIEPLLSIKKSTRPEKTAFLIKQTMEKMNTHLTPELITKIMYSCGRDCAAHNKRAIEVALKRRAKHPTIEAYLDSEEKNPRKGTRLKQEGDIIIQWYTPNIYKRPMRCYCGLQRGLPMDLTTSINYCKCSESFVQTQWEQILERPVEVKVLESAISGAEECKFQIRPI